MNILNVSLQHSILTLAAHGWSHRRIARELDLNRETVGRYLRLARSKPAISTPGSESDPAAKPAILTLGSEGDSDPKPAISTAGCGRQSSCLPWQPQIEAAVSVGLSALGAGLYSLGIPKNSIIQYETAVKSGKYVLIAHGSDTETIHAREILKNTNPETLAEHQPKRISNKATVMTA